MDKQVTIHDEQAASTAVNVTVCHTCGQTGDHRCNHQSLQAVCSYCGSLADGANHVCKPLLAAATHYCENCGRVAEAATAVCRPTIIQ